MEFELRSMAFSKLLVSFIAMIRTVHAFESFEFVRDLFYYLMCRDACNYRLAMAHTYVQ